MSPPMAVPGPASPLSLLLVTRDAMPHAAAAVEQLSRAAADFEAQVVAVDAGSTDGTRELLDGQRGWLVEQQQGTGLAGARNQALALATGEVLAFLDADDVWLPGKLEAQLAALAADPSLDVVSCLLQRVGQDGAVAAPQVALTPSGCVLRRSGLERVGAFDERYALACDHDWFVRARRAGVRTQVLPEVLLHKGIHAGNLSHDRSRYSRELAEVLRQRPAAGRGDG